MRSNQGVSNDTPVTFRVHGRRGRFTFTNEEIPRQFVKFEGTAQECSDWIERADRRRQWRKDVLLGLFLLGLCLTAWIFSESMR